jgi:predicted ArsR family transcriptional regulator
MRACRQQFGDRIGSYSSAVDPTDQSGGSELSAEAAIGAVAALNDELRRGMFDFIRSARRPVTREQAADAVGISTKLAAFHLDKLVEAGLLRAHYARPGVPRVGRTAKVYEPVSQDVRISIPSRHHDVLAEILVEAVTAQREGEAARDAAVRVARQHGRAAAEVVQRRPGRLGAERALTISDEVLRNRGYQPDRASAGDLRLRNCPFHPLAAREPALVCGLNHAFLSGFLDALDASTVTAVLDPTAGECCVRLQSSRSGH